jgi:uncharacterized Zn finger protein
MVVAAVHRGAGVPRSRLPADPGRNYARRGQVLSLDVTPGEVRASVQGSRRAPYCVTIGLSPLPELTWAKVEVALAEQAIHSARLLDGEMPPDLEEVFAAAGAPLFPQRAEDLTMACSCPDLAVPCKHLAATFYLLAESFDQDPFRILAWRGRERSSLLSRLRDLRGDSPYQAPDDSSAGRSRCVGAAMALDDDMVADGAARDDGTFAFWEGTPPPALPTHPALPADFVLRQLPCPAPRSVGSR